MRIGVDVTEILERSDSVLLDLVPPPGSDVPGVCPHCRTWISGADEGGRPAFECENCVEVREALDAEPLRLAVISLYRKPSALRDWLTRYKGREDEEDVFVPEFVDVVAALLGRFLHEHGQACDVAWGPLDGIVVVPSTDRPAPHPLEAIVESLGLEVPLMRLLERGDGQLGFRQPAKDGYRVVLDSPPMRLLLIDDVYTTGSRVNSAAAALSVAGHEVVGALVLARRVNPDYTDEARRYWDAASETPFSWDVGPWLPT